MARKIALGGDHAGFEFKQRLIDKLKSDGYEVKDFGPYDDQSVDYPDYVHPLAEAIENRQFGYGLLICGSGNGVAITANKHAGIRASLCWNEELAALSRQHNNCNIMCMPARFVSYGQAEKMVEIFLSTDFEGGRHQKRVDKISC